MTREKKRQRIRIWIAVHYGIVVLMLPFVYYGKLLMPHWYLLLLPFLAIIFGLTISHEHAFGKTNLWTLTHSRPQDLDERERDVAYEALAKSYRWITIIMLLSIYLIILAYDEMLVSYLAWAKPVVPVLALALIYASHTLPAAIIGWRELPTLEPAEQEAGLA